MSESDSSDVDLESDDYNSSEVEMSEDEAEVSEDEVEVSGDEAEVSDSEVEASNEDNSDAEVEPSDTKVKLTVEKNKKAKSSTTAVSNHYHMYIKTFHLTHVIIAILLHCGLIMMFLVSEQSSNAKGNPVFAYSKILISIILRF